MLYDPSYWGQIVVMTASHIGNTGVNRSDDESSHPYLTGFAARSFEGPSNWRAERSLHSLLKERGIPAIEALDTRSLTIRLRNIGCMRGGIFPADIPENEALSQVLAHPRMTGLDGATRVSCREVYDWGEGTTERWLGSIKLGREGRHSCRQETEKESALRVAVWDYGVKRNILRRLVDVGCRVRVFPAWAEPEEIEEFKPDGLLLSNGPGDPAAVPGVSEKIRYFFGKLPIFGICLGHQLLALAAGGRTYKMKFGHRGINHPVGESPESRVLVTVHNHGFAVSDDHLPDGAQVTLRSLNDGTIEGLDYPDLNAFSVQFHPEASPGPHDAADFFTLFRQRMERHAGAS